MDDAWFTGMADELARCLVDAEASAEACEQLLEAALLTGDVDLLQQLRDALVAPAAVARVLIELIDQPPPLVLAAARLYCDRGEAAIVQLESLDRRIDGAGTLAALRASV